VVQQDQVVVVTAGCLVIVRCQRRGEWLLGALRGTCCALTLLTLEGCRVYCVEEKVPTCVLARVEVVGVRGCQSWVLMMLVRVVGQVVGEQQRSVEEVLSVPLAAAVVVDVVVGGVVAEGRLTCDVVTPC